MATRGKDRRTREQRDRARAHRARVELYERQGRRRTRDNVLGLVIGLLVIAGAIGAQTTYFVAGPGAPAPSPTSTPTTPAIAPTDGATPAATETPAATGEQTPAP